MEDGPSSMEDGPARPILAGGDTLEVLFWNVENFFDWRNDSTSVSDAEFSAAGERHWTWKRFQAKANAFAKALLWVGSETGRLPDIVGLEEVENAFVLRQVLQKTLLRKLDYKYVHYDSPDHRGIDVALLYRTSRLELLDSRPCHLFDADTVMATRDILLCVFRRAGISVMPDTPFSVMHGSSFPVMPDPSFLVIPGLTGNLSEDSGRCPIGVGHDEDSFVEDGYTHVHDEVSLVYDGDSFVHDEVSLMHDEVSLMHDGVSLVHDGHRTGRDGRFAVLVNHHPSKYGGAAESEPRRRIAVERLRFLADSLAALGIDRIIAGGDFNDTPDNPVFQRLSPALVPLHMDLFHRGLGTIKYDGKWELIDHIYVSPTLLGAPMPADPSAGVRILRIPFLLTRDTAHSGEKPLRTYTGPRHTGGVSDHLPVLLEVTLPP